MDLYPDWKNGVLSQEQFLTLKANTQEQLSALDASIEKLQNSIADLKKDMGADNDFLRRFRELGTVPYLTRPLVTELIDKILVHEDRRIEIIPKYADAYATILEYIEANKAAALLTGEAV